MKRPSGFDAGPNPEPREPARSREKRRASAAPLPRDQRGVSARASSSPDAQDTATVADLGGDPDHFLPVVDSDPADLPLLDRAIDTRSVTDHPPVPVGPAEPAPGRSAERHVLQAEPPEHHERPEHPEYPAPDGHADSPSLPGIDDDASAGRGLWAQVRGVGDPVRAASRRVQAAARSRRTRERLEQRRFTAHLRRRRRVWFVSVGAVVALVVFVLAGVFTPIMAVREVQVLGTSRLDAQEVVTALSRFDGVPLALVADQEVHRALAPFPLIQRYAIERIPPHTLRVRIEERDPVIALEREDGFGLVDAAGVLVAEAPERPEGVPLAAGTVVDTASPAFRAASAIMRDLPSDLRVQVGVATATTGQDVELSLSGGTRVVWGGHEETQRKAVVLRAMLQALGPVAVIDVSAPDTPVFQ